MNVAAFLLTAVLTAQTPNPQIPSGLKPGRIEGAVTNLATGGPIKKANVSLMGAGNSSQIATSDAGGHFHFDLVDPGTYHIFAEGSGYTAGQSAGRGPGQSSLTLTEGQEIKDVAISLLPLGVVSGRVVDEDGDPMARATVTALHYSYNQGRKQLIQGGFASTNDLGEFQMIDVVPGKYFFEATAPSRMRNLPGHVADPSREQAPEQAYPPTYYPNALDLSQATAAEVKPGAELGSLEFHLERRLAYHVRGTIVDGLNNQSVRNTNLRLERPGAAFGRPSPTPVRIQEDGKFDIRNVFPGSYIVTAQKAQNPNATFARQTVNVANQDIEGLVLTLSPGFDINGVVTIEGSAADQQFTRLPDNPGAFQIFLEALGNMGFGARAITNGDGTFVIHGVLPDRYRVNVAAMLAGKYVKSVQFNEQDVPDGGIDLTHQSGGTLRVVFGGDPCLLSGSVQTRSGAPAANVLVSAAPPADRPGRPDLFKTVMSDQNGRFRFQNLAPGEYRVFASESSGDNPFQVPEFQKLFESAAASVRLQPNGNESIQLKLIPAAEIEAGKEKLL
jgi:hypothetical protein